MKYVGNTALSPQIQERIQNTFTQTLSLAEEGSRQEALLGCDFILRLDPLFEPARRLQERLNQGDGPVAVDGLLEEAAPAAPAPASSAPVLEVAEPIEDASVDIAELIADAPFDDADLTADLPARLAMLLEQREFQELINLATQNQDQVSGDADLRALVTMASERLEAEPYVRNFLDSAQAAKEKDDLEGARAHLEKARELDASHPEIAVLEADLLAARVEPADAFEPQPLIDAALGDDATVASTAEVDSLFASTDDTVSEPTLAAEPTARLDSESEQRIQELLKEGQESFEEGQYQTAIDAWSRIFLIDIDHAEASRRIELARKLKAEVERQIEEAFHEGISLLESGDEEKAREAFDRVLELQPNHMGARDYLDKLAAGTLHAAPAPPDLAPLPQEQPEPEIDTWQSDATLDMAPTAPAPAKVSDDLPLARFDVPPRPAPRRRSFFLIGTAVLVLVLAAGWFVVSNWNRFFPGSTEETETAAAVPQTDPIEKALELHESGNTPMAINMLRRLNPGHQQYAEAQALIAMWETDEAPTQPVSNEPSETALARRSELLGAAGQALARGENLLALDLLDDAAGIVELGEEELALKAQAVDALELLRDERDLFEQGDWEYALPNLWRIHDADPANKDAIRLMVDSYYNLGLRDLQRGDAKSALEKFEEARDLTDGDEALDRLAEFADAYSQRPSDMLFRIFVKYQRFR